MSRGTEVENNLTSTPADDSSLNHAWREWLIGTQPKISQYIYVFDSLNWELQSLNVEQKQTLDNITDRIVSV